MNALVRFAAAVLLVAPLGCGGGDTSPSTQGVVIGPAGGTAAGANGAKVVVPPSALTADTLIAIERSSAGAPALPAGLSPLGPMFALTPHGTTFAVPVTLTLPFDPASAPAGARLALYKTNAENRFERLANAAFGAESVSAKISSFSLAQVVTEPQGPDQLLRTVTFSPTGAPDEIIHDNEAELDMQRLIGPAGLFEIQLDGDDTSALEAFSSPDGVPFWVVSEDGKGGVLLEQSQSFIKEADDATLEVVITAALVGAVDFNGDPWKSECPYGEENVLVCNLIQASVSFKAEVTTVSFEGEELLYGSDGTPALDTGTVVELNGRMGKWEDFVGQPWDAETSAFSRAQLEITKDVNGDAWQSRPLMRLASPVVIRVDLSSVKRLDQFWLNTTLHAETVNQRGRESGVGAFLRDPARIGGSAMHFTGLRPSAAPRPTPRVPPRAAPCTTGPDPQAGELQFSAAGYTVLEGWGDARRGSAILITRTNGSKGAISATLSVGGGSGVPGVHYTPLGGTVRFADGDMTPRTVGIDILQNANREPETTVDLTLSAPGGCATLGALSRAVLTILDDDRLPPPPPDSGLDPTFGVDGKATSPAFGGSRSSMALQADGKIVMAGGTFTDFILARFNANGSLDTGFGVGGKVITDMGSGEEATAVAIQSDGKIVVAGYTGIDNVPPAPSLPQTFALARYNSDGSLDAGFGSGGRVSGNVNGRAYAVAIQGDGKIVLAGEFSISSTSGGDFSDFALARFDTDGRLDAGFGGTGQLTTDLGGGTNIARNIVLQPNGAIVVSGKPQGSAAGTDHTDLARYLPDGRLDASFGAGGKLVLAGALVGEGLALQSDGNLVLVGSITIGTSPNISTRFALRRLGADGSPDTTFGAAGAVDTAFATSATANAVALQSDGKIVLVGTTALAANPNFVVARYDADGSVDPTFGPDGYLSIDFFGFTDAGASVLLQPDGKIVLGGLARDNVDGYGLVRINP